jgi:hypothetical protein
MEQRDENLRHQLNILLKWEQQLRVAAAEQQRQQQAQAALSLFQHQQALFTPQELTAAVAVAAHVQNMQRAVATMSAFPQPTTAAPPTCIYSPTVHVPSMAFNYIEGNTTPVTAVPSESLVECSTESAVAESSSTVKSTRNHALPFPSAPSCPESDRPTSSHNDTLDPTGKPPVKLPPPCSRVARKVTGSPAVSSSSSSSCLHKHTKKRDRDIPPAPAAPKSLVHQACELYPQSETIVASALRVDGEGARRRRSVCASYTTKSHKRSRHLHEYPITIALHHDASLSVLQLLVDAAPDVLVQVDGDEQGSALSTALMQKRDLSIISLLLEANPDQVRVHDRYRNYPLHASCIYGACLKVVQLVASAYPSALRKKNFHGMTPLDIAQRNAFCSDDVIDYLQQTSFGSLEEDAIHMEDSFIVKEDTGKTIASCKRVGNAACQSKHPAGV